MLGAWTLGAWLLAEEPVLAGVLALEPGVPVSVGVALDDGLVLGLPLGDGVVAGDEGALLEGDGCGWVGDDPGAGCCDAEGEDDGMVEVAVVAPDGAHDGTGADSSAIVGTFGSSAPGPDCVAPIMAACAAACGALPALVAAEGDAELHCGPRFVPVGAAVAVGTGTAAAGEADGPVPGPAAGFGAGVPLPSVLVPSTLSDCPPVSTLELTCTTACRSGATASVAATANAIPASTAAGRNQPRPLAARSTARMAGDNSGTRGFIPRGKGDAGLSPRGKSIAGQAQ